MRWEALFADLAARADALERAERDQEIAERYRIESGSVTLRARLSASAGRRIHVRLSSGSLATGVVADVGPDWVLVRDERNRETVLATAAVVSVHGLDRSSDADARPNAVADKLSIRSVLRAISRERSVVRIELRGGADLTGQIDRVASDHVDLTARRVGEIGRAAAPDSTAVAISALAMLTRQLA